MRKITILTTIIGLISLNLSAQTLKYYNLTINIIW
jgi:hypothetical protein